MQEGRSLSRAFLTFLLSAIRNLQSTRPVSGGLLGLETVPFNTGFLFVAKTDRETLQYGSSSRSRR